MRQNTKVIVASSQPPDDENPLAGGGAQGQARSSRTISGSPRKASQQTWVKEPWNGKTRRQSIKMAGGMARKKVSGPVPPLPGQESSVKESTGVDADGVAPPEDLADDEERGRLFVKVVGVKDLDLPLPRGMNYALPQASGNM